MSDRADTASAPNDEAPAEDWTALLARARLLLGPPGEAPLGLDLVRVASAQDAVEAGSDLIAAAAAGEISLREAQAMMRLLTGQTRLFAALRRLHRSR